MNLYKDICGIFLAKILTVIWLFLFFTFYFKSLLLKVHWRKMRVQGGDGFLLTELLGKEGIFLPPAGVVKQYALQDASLAVEVLN